MKSSPCCSSVVTSLLTLLPPSFTRSFATPPSTWVNLTKNITETFSHDSSQRNRRPKHIICSARPVMSVNLIPIRPPSTPAPTLVATPASS